MAWHLFVNHLEPIMSKLIPPTPGRVVWYWPSQQEIDAKSIAVIDQAQPLAATVAHVWHDRMVNLSVVDQAGAQFRRTSVKLMQEDDERPHTSEEPFAEWMPYQKTAALKEDLQELQHAALSLAVDAMVSEQLGKGADPLPGESPVAQVMADAKQLADAVAGLPPEAGADSGKAAEPAA